MAMINCPECNESISDRAHTCPSCGYPIEIYVKKLKETEERKKSEDLAKRQMIEADIRQKYEAKFLDIEKSAKNETASLKDEILNLSNQNKKLQDILEQENNRENKYKDIESEIRKEYEAKFLEIEKTAKEEASSLKNEILTLSNQNAELQNSLENEKRSNAELKTRLEENAKEVEHAEEMSTSYKRELEKISEESKKELSKLSDELRSSEEEKARVCAELSQLKNESEMIAVKRKEQSDSAINELKALYDEKITQINEISAKEKESLKCEISQLKGLNEDLKKQVDALSAENESKDNMISLIRNSSLVNESEKSELGKLREELQSVKVEIDKREKELNENIQSFIKEKERTEKVKEIDSLSIKSHETIENSAQNSSSVKVILVALIAIIIVMLGLVLTVSLKNRRIYTEILNNNLQGSQTEEHSLAISENENTDVKDVDTLTNVNEKAEPEADAKEQIINTEEKVEEKKDKDEVSTVPGKKFEIRFYNDESLHFVNQGSWIDYYYAGDDSNLSVSSDDSSIASASLRDGHVEVFAVGVGNTNIVLQDDYGNEASIRVEGIDADIFPKGQKSLNVGESFQLYVKNSNGEDVSSDYEIEWFTDDPQIISMSNNGVATANGPGKVNAGFGIQNIGKVWVEFVVK